MKKSQPAKLMASVPLVIPFHDVDLTGVAWHGRYLKYFELARDALMDRIGYSYAQMRESGFIFPVVDVQLRYLRPLRMGQQLEVTAALKEWEMRVVLDYEIRDAAGLVHCRGKTVQVAVSADRWELRLGSPQELLDRVAAQLAALAVEE